MHTQTSTTAAASVCVFKRRRGGGATGGLSAKVGTRGGTRLVVEGDDSDAVGADGGGPHAQHVRLVRLALCVCV